MLKLIHIFQSITTTGIYHLEHKQLTQPILGEFLKENKEIIPIASNNILRGIEKEGLRVSPSGYISQQPHQEKLGSKLTHPYITTDYAESLLEFITPTFESISDMLEFLEQLHIYTYQAINDELIWVASMPCSLTKEADIPIADYGNSNVGMMKHIYRQGLAHRYGKNMQTIAGIHFNFSLKEPFWHEFHKQKKPNIELQTFKNEQYLRLTRNFFRNSWILTLLYGASPAACSSFDNNNNLNLTKQKDQSIYGEFATSLRMSDIGYSNNAQSELFIPYNNIADYCHALYKATTTKHPEFAKIPLKIDNQYQQLNQNILQIEAEYYSPIRPKRVAASGERPICALFKRGIEYIEVRILDLNPFIPTGISEEQIKFLDVFLITCLFDSDTELSQAEKNIIKKNEHLIVTQGRNPKLKLHTTDNKQITNKKRIADLGDKLLAVAASLDSANSDTDYYQTIIDELAKLETFDQLPSTKIINKILTEDKCFFDIAMTEAIKTKDYYKNKNLSSEVKHHLEKIAEDSLIKQKEIEDNDLISLDEQIANYFTEPSC